MHIQIFRGSDLVFSDGPCTWAVNGSWLIIFYQNGTQYLFPAGPDMEVRVLPEEDDE